VRFGLSPDEEGVVELLLFPELLKIFFKLFPSELLLPLL
jgi:hypothetical protein